MKRYRLYYVILILISLLFLHTNVLSMLDRVNNMMEINEIRGFWNLPYSNIDEEFQMIVNEITLFIDDLPNNILNRTTSHHLYCYCFSWFGVWGFGCYP